MGTLIDKTHNPHNDTQRSRAHSDDRTYRLPRATIHNLPVELLSMIFLYAYSSTGPPKHHEYTHRRRALPGSVYRLPQNRDLESNFSGRTHHDDWSKRPTMVNRDILCLHYPLYALSTCRLWRNIAKHTWPELPNHLLLFVDEKYRLSASQIELQIQRAESELPLDIFVTSAFDCDGSDDAEIQEEKLGARKIMQVVANLLPRCRSLVFSMKYCSSLPYISQDFSGAAPELLTLKLRCRVDNDATRLSDTAGRSQLQKQFRFPRLTRLALDGHTFVDAFRHMPFLNQIKRLSLDTLSVSNFNSAAVPFDDESRPFNVARLAYCAYMIGYLRHLILDHVDIAGEYGASLPSRFELPLDNLTVIKHRSSCIKEFFSVTFGSTLCYYHLSETPLDEGSIPMVHHLRLEKIPEMGPPFSKALMRFHGNRLDFIDCEALNDKHLYHVARQCDMTCRVYIIRCPNITVEGLKAMITTRRRLVLDREGFTYDDEDEVAPDLRGHLGDESIHPTERPGNTGTWNNNSASEADSDTESLVECNDEIDQPLAKAYIDFHKTEPRKKSYLLIHRLCVEGLPIELSGLDRQWFGNHVKSFTWTM